MIWSKYIKAYNDSYKEEEKKVGFAIVILEITRRVRPKKEASLYTTKMIIIKINLKEIYNRENKQWVIWFWDNNICCLSLFMVLKTKKLPVRYYLQNYTKPNI